MPATDSFTRHATLEELVHTTDGAGGWNDVWTARGAVACRVNPVSSKESLQYRRVGFENVVRLIAPSTLPVRIEGFKLLRELMLEKTRGRFRYVLDGRTLTPVSVIQPNEGTVPAPGDFVTIDCIETPQPVGIQDA